MPRTQLLDAVAASSLLGVSRATLYAYVSRGIIGAEPDPADPRRRLYRAPDIERLQRAKSRGRRTTAIAAETLDWGSGALPSRITLVEHGRLYYRGEETIRLAERASLEEIARMLWDSGPADPFGPPPETLAPPPLAAGAAAPLDRCRALLPLLAAGSRPLWNRDKARLGTDAAALLRALAAIAIGRPTAPAPIHLQIAGAWGLDAVQAELVRAALVLLADHELNPSTFAARVVAGTGASLSACVAAGLAALSGPLHGGATAMAEALFAAADQSGDPVGTVEARLARGERMPAFGHPLYPDGDPRAGCLLARLPPDPVRAALIDTVADVAGLAPNIDFALASLTRALRLPAGSGILLFAIARSVGWMAHALEQNAEGKIIRPRAEYVGIRPA